MSSEIRLAEGGARSVTWCQIIADCLGRRVDLISERDTSAAGAAIIGHAAHTGAAVEEIAQRSVRIDRAFEPGAHNREVLEASYQRYRAMCPLIGC
ncbi:FGGY-family carbohydrate kinase [Nitratireductor sp. XY-223]|uniref:FGGY-family carbohydrate kinase n=1 Tax=Nitratireductor sp. XY-223 TaxID=2561926 RepID=UPI00145B8CE5|nr:FGGY-family carbohydrate kinase [Nitratireductor sp. XY-223]